jgi:hypothetical protein
MTPRPNATNFVMGPGNYHPPGLCLHAKAVRHLPSPPSESARARHRVRRRLRAGPRWRHCRAVQRRSSRLDLQGRGPSRIRGPARPPRGAGRRATRGGSPAALGEPDRCRPPAAALDLAAGPRQAQSGVRSVHERLGGEVGDHARQAGPHRASGLRPFLTFGGAEVAYPRRRAVAARTYGPPTPFAFLSV